ncbi:uncharacterized protein avpi1 [Austrofundulus limnaeus]|uniref:Arginine vasopressin-induced protein 1 n=1 Tax=Austrofundulus limnaeus TaxID=52670 RepID=A0A2I4CQP4_AUSLI|nr:PREDICTED: uncharacterized protein LOC106531092 [Austrofundulus limnaeus]
MTLQLEVGQLSIRRCEGFSLNAASVIRLCLRVELETVSFKLQKKKNFVTFMAEALDFSSAEDSMLTQWKPSSRHSRKSGCSNIFSGVNLHQLHRLFRTAGDRNAEHRAKLVCQEMEADMEGEEEGQQKEGEEREDEAGLAQALVGLRVRARNKTGLRSEGHSDHKILRASGFIRVEEPSVAFAVEDNLTQSLEEFEQPTTEEDVPEIQNPFKSASWRVGVRLESSRDSERYLHRILH